MKPKYPQSTCPCSKGGCFKANCASRFLFWAPLMHKFAHLPFFARIALGQDFPVELAGVQDAFCHALLQIAGVRIDFACLHLTWVLCWQEVRRIDGLPNGFAISSSLTGNVADGDTLAIQFSDHESFLECSHGFPPQSI